MSRMMELSPQCDVDLLIASLAARQHGVVARAQLLEAGMPAHVVDHRVRRRRLLPLYRGVYRVGPVPGPLERQMAAVLACGSSALLLDEAAAGVWRFPFERDAGGDMDVGVVGAVRAPGPGVRVHRLTRLGADERTVHNGVPITTPARTVLDLAAHLGSADLERVLAHGVSERILDPGDVAALVARHPTRPGTRMLRALLRDPGRIALTRSEAEARFLALVRNAGIPEPETNRRVGGFEVDVLWRRARLIVEIDGFAYHGSATAFERDRRRDATLIAAGFRVIRFTWRQLVHESGCVLFRLGQVLGPVGGQ
jgi:very-short-patch-repair endonuclease